MAMGTWSLFRWTDKEQYFSVVKTKNKVQNTMHRFISEEFKSGYLVALAGVTWLAGVSSPTPEGGGLDSQSGHISRLRVQSLIGACRGGN